MCSLDPGVRKFLTGYSPDGSGFVLRCNTSKVLDKCIRRIDKRKDNLEAVFGKSDKSKQKKQNTKCIFTGKNTERRKRRHKML